MRGAPDSYAIRLPPEWREFPIDEEGLRRSRIETIDSLRKAPGWTKTAERRTELIFAQLGHALRAIKACYCAFFAGMSSDEQEDGADAAPDLLLAGLAVSTLSRADLDTDVPLTPDTVLAAYSMDRESPSGATNVEPPSVVTLEEAGRAVRLVRLVELGKVDGSPVQIFSETFMVPVADGEGVCVLQFTTPNLEDSPLFSRLFGAIASTVRVLYEDTPTLPEGAGLA